MSEPSRSQERIRQALELLRSEVQAQVAAHPWGHLLAGRGGDVDIRLRVPVAPREGEMERAREALEADLSDGIRSLVAHRATFRPGRIFCLRCGSATCQHSAPGSSREIFAGYGPSGLPRFAEMGQWLLERGDPRVDLLYQDRPRFLAHVASGADLTASLLPAYRDEEGGYRLHGQVAAAWYRGSDADGHPALVALSFQIVSTKSANARRRYGLNLVGAGPGGESLELFCNRLDAIPWAVPVRWAQSVLGQIERSRRSGEAARERRIEGLLRGLAGRLEKDRRAAGRRTRHAEKRHARGDRPTRMALADLARADADSVLYDTRRETLVVLGERGRAHVFNPAGKLVTSIRYSPESIARRRKDGQWRTARDEEVQGLKERIAAAGTGDP